jgi:hypothetical protein
MAFTETAREQLRQLNKDIRYSLSVRNAHPEGNAWVELQLAGEGFTLVADRSELATSLSFATPATAPLHFDELDPANPLALYSELKLEAEVAGESEALFRGFITEVVEEGALLRVHARDQAVRLSRSLCQVELEGGTTDEITNAPLVALPDEYDAHTFGFDAGSTPDGFSPTGGRRAWKPGDIRVYSAGDEVQPDFYCVYPESGVVRFSDPIPQAPTVGSVRCYLEGTSDVSAAVTAALQYPQADGGAGIPPEELELPMLGVDLHRLEWRRGQGTAASFAQALTKRLPRNYFFRYDSVVGKHKHSLLEQSATPARSLINVSAFAHTRTRAAIYTRVVVTGRRTNPPNLALGADITDLQEGVGEKYAWDGNDKQFGQGSVALIYDGDSNTGFGRHDAPYAYQFYDFALLDLGLDEDGLPPRISSVEVVASNSQNVNSQKSANTMFSYGYELLGSEDGVSYERISPDALLLLPPLAIARLSGLTMPRVRYLKVRVKPAKDGVSNESDPGLALNEIRVYGDDWFAAEARVQDEDSEGEFYYPELLEKAQAFGPQALIVDVGDSLAETEAAKLAAELLAESLFAYNTYEIESIADPTLHLGETVSYVHPVTGEEHAMVVERIELTPVRTRVFGTDYNAEVLR